MTEKIEFRTEKRKISDLIDCSYNPRTISKKQYKDLKNSFKKFGYVEICAINTDNTIIAGHQRVHIMKDLGWEDKEIEVRVPNRQLEKKEFDEYLIRSNQNGGSYDWDLLANDFEFDELCEWGFEKDTLIKDFDLEEENKSEDDENEINCEQKLVVEIEVKNEREQRELFEEMNSRGLKCRVLTL